ncbi:MAG: 3-phosphoshikimate 1-carboxyvinyltransferase, partial [Candidatus Methanoplasma sp.]|nr:3-phosphoshikimate 1-carboxyvinyltransferase [Candidatus Methanoplasma sp.]
MKASFGGGQLNGSVHPPASKSHTHRAFFLAAMADGTSRISNALLSEDTKATLKASEAMGAEVERNGDTVTIKGGDLHAPTGTVDALNSG